MVVVVGEEVETVEVMFSNANRRFGFVVMVVGKEEVL
jgi:hypothetical protein